MIDIVVFYFSCNFYCAENVKWVFTGYLYSSWYLCCLFLSFPACPRFSFVFPFFASSLSSFYASSLHACFHKEGLPIRYFSVSSQHFSLPFFFLPLSTSFFSSSCLSSLKKFMDEISREIFAIFNVFTRT